jgi:hypothetical protein
VTNARAIFFKTSQIIGGGALIITSNAIRIITP